MAQLIKHKRNATAGVTPAAGSLTPGELAINTADGKLFTKTDAGVVQEIGGGGGAGLAVAGSISYTIGRVIVTTLTPTWVEYANARVMVSGDYTIGAWMGGDNNQIVYARVYVNGVASGTQIGFYGAAKTKRTIDTFALNVGDSIQVFVYSYYAKGTFYSAFAANAASGVGNILPLEIGER